MYKAEVRIALKKGVADPEGKNAHKALELLGFQGLREVKTEKVFEVFLDAASEEVAHHRAEEMCKRLLANPVIHEYRIRVERVEPASGREPSPQARGPEGSAGGTRPAAAPGRAP